MEILRLPPYPLEADVVVPDDNKEYSIYIDGELIGSETSGVDMYAYDGEPFVTFEVPAAIEIYDGEYVLVVKDGNDVVYEDSLRITRPYIDVAKDYKDKDYEEYAGYERLVRLIIDNIVGGFYYSKITFERMGTGTDVLPLGYPIKKLLSVQENGYEVYSDQDSIYDYVISDNGLYIKAAAPGDISEGGVLVVPTGSSDTYGTRSYGAQFGYDYSYMIVAESGYRMVPEDVKTIARRMIDGLACGTANYLQRYIVKYETDEYRVDFDRRAFVGTGDLVVDQTLKRYWRKTLFRNVATL